MQIKAKTWISRNKLSYFSSHKASFIIGLFVVFAVLSTLIYTNYSPKKAQAAAGINEQLNYQARLLDSTGAVVADGTYNMEFKIYQDGTGCVSGGSPPCSGTLKWTETRTSTNKVTVKNGYFSVNLGSVTAFSTSVDWNQDTLWLSINIGGTGSPSWDGEMTPFRRLAAVPYAMNAKQLGGLDYSRFVQLAPTAVQVDSGTLSSIFINKTGASGNILQLQKNGTNVLTLDNAGVVNSSYTSTSSTAGLEIGSIWTNTDTGAVTTGTDDTRGMLVSVSRTGGSGSAVLNTYGVYGLAQGDTGGTSTVIGVAGIAVSGDVNYGVTGLTLVTGSGQTEAVGVFGSIASFAGFTGTQTTTNALKALVDISTAGTYTTASGLSIETSTLSGGGTIGTNYGAWIKTQTVGTTNYGLRVDTAAGAGTNQTVWIAGNDASATTAAKGIAFGSTKDVTLYRGGATTLQTDGSFLTGGRVAVNSIGSPGTNEIFRVNTPNTVDNSTIAIITNTGTNTNKVLTLQGVAGQFAAYLSNQTSAGTTLSSIDLLGSFRAPSGTNTTPGLTFQAENTLGLYRVSSGVLGITANADVAQFSSTGQTLTGDFTFTTGATRTISLGTSTTGTGNTLTIQGATGLAAGPNAGGIVSLTGGTGGSSTGLGSGGAGGAVNISGGATYSNNWVGSVGGAVNISGATPIASVVATSSTGGALVLTAGTGGAASGFASSGGGAGGAVSITSGSGGAAGGGGDKTGGNGAGITLTAGSGGVSIGTNANSNGGSITFQGGSAGTGGGGAAGTPGNINLQVATNGNINVGANAVAQTVNIGNGTGATAVSVLCGSGACGFGNNGVAHSTIIGSTTGGSITYIQTGTAGLNIANDGVSNTVQIGNANTASSQTINIGNNANASGISVLNIGSGQSSSATTIQAGSGGLFLGTAGISNTIQIGNTTGAVAQTINFGTNSTGSSTTNINIGSSIAGTTAITGPTTITGRTSGALDTLTVSNSTSTGSIAIFKDGSTAVMTIADGGGILLQNQTNSAAGLQVKDSSTEVLFSVDTTARGAGGGNLVKIGNSTGTDTATTILKLDAATAVPTTNLAALNGGMFYNSTTNKISVIENGTVKVLCNTTDAGCGAGGATTLQSAYDATSGNTITTTDGRNIAFTFADTTTDSSFIVNLQCVTSCSTNGVFAVQSAGTNVFTVSPNGGRATFRNVTDSTTGLQILDADGGTPIFNVDTTNERVGIGTAAPNAIFEVIGTATTGPVVSTTASIVGTSGIFAAGTNMSTTASPSGLSSIGYYFGIYNSVDSGSSNVDSSILTSIATQAIYNGGDTLAGLEGIRVYLENGTGTITTSTGIYVSTGSNSGTITTQYGILVASQGGGSSSYGIAIDTAGTQSLWLQGNGGTAATGIGFGTSNDTNLYRSDANLLRSDDSLHIVNRVQIGLDANVGTIAQCNALIGFGDCSNGIEVAIASTETTNVTYGASFIAAISPSGATNTAGNKGSNNVLALVGTQSFSGNNIGTDSIAVNGTTAGTVTMLNGANGFATQTGAGSTVTTATGVRAGVSQTAGTLTTGIALDVLAATGTISGSNYGIIVRNQTAGATDYGIYIEDAANYSLVLASNDGDAASGISFGSVASTPDTNLYRGAANQLNTDDALKIGTQAAIGSGASIAAGTALYVNETFNNTSGGVQGQENRIFINAASASSAIVLASNSNLTVQGTAINYTGTYLAGSGGTVNVDTTGTVSTALGSAGIVSNRQGGTIAAAHAQNGLVVNSAGGTITAATALWGQIQNNSTGTITDGAGLWIAASTNTSGTLTRNYGIYIENQTAGTTDYGIVIEDAANYSLLLASNDGDAASGISFGSVASTPDTNLYRSAANQLKTDDNFLVQTAINSTNAFAVNNASGLNLLKIDNSSSNPSNLVTNPSFETNTTGWTGRTGCTLTQDTSNFYNGAASGLCTNTATTNAGMNYPVALSSTTSYNVIVYVKTNGLPISTLEIGRADNGASDTACLTAQSVNSNGWTRFSCSFTTGTTSGSPYIYVKQTDGVARNIYVDAVVLQTSSNADSINYRDGKISFGTNAITSPLVLQNVQNSSTAFTVNNSNGGQVFGVDTTDQNQIANPSFEVNTTGWAAKGAATIVRSTSQQNYGNASLLVTTTAAANDGAQYTLPNPIQVGQQVTLSGYIRLNATAFGAGTLVGGYVNGSGDTTCVLAPAISATVPGTTGWTRFTCTFTVATTQATAVFLKQTDSVARSFYIDATQLENGATTTAYGLGRISLSGEVINPTTFRNQADTTTAFQVVNAANTTTLFNIDTLNSNVAITSTATTSSALTLTANSLTTGKGIDITSTSATTLSSGALIGVTANSATTATGGLVQINANALTTGVGLNLTSTNTTTLSTGALFRITANSLTTGGNAGGVAQIQMNAATTARGLSITSTSAGLTSGSLLYISTSTTGAVATNGVVSINASGAYSSTSNAGLLNVAANATLTGTLANFSATALTSGVAINVAGPTSGSTFTGSLFNASTATTGAASNGFVRFNFSAAHTGNGFQIDDATATGTGMAINATALTSGTGLNIAGPTSGSTLTGTLLNISTATTGAATNGFARFNFTGAHTGVGFQLDDTATTTGTAMAINVTGLTTGTGLKIANTTSISSADNLVILTGGNNAGAETGTHIQFQRADGTVIGSIAQNAATTVAYNTTSDARLKENITDTHYDLNTVLALKIHDYDYLADPNHTQLTGLIAQELYTLYPGAVTVGTDAVDDQGRLTNPWSIDYGKLTPLLAKGLQDLNGKVDALDAKVNAQQVSQGVFNGGLVTGNIEFQANATFDAIATFKGQAVFAGGATFNGTATFNDKIVVSSNTAGTVKLLAGQTKVSIQFSKPYTAPPIINATPIGIIAPKYGVTNITKDGFDIDIDPAQPTDTQFNWFAVETNP